MRRGSLLEIGTRLGRQLELDDAAHLMSSCSSREEQRAAGGCPARMACLQGQHLHRTHVGAAAMRATSQQQLVGCLQDEVTEVMHHASKAGVHMHHASKAGVLTQ
jgi:hypothetical protein